MKNIVVVLTFGIMFCVYLFCLCWGRWKDVADKKLIAKQAAAAKEVETKEKADKDKRMASLVSLASSMANANLAGMHPQFHAKVKKAEVS